MKPYAESSEVNKAPILAVLRGIFTEHKLILEIASGTGQHAVHFAEQMPHLTWQPSELSKNLPGIQAWLDEAKLPNVLPPIAIDVNGACWSSTKVDACAFMDHTTTTEPLPQRATRASMFGLNHAILKATYAILKPSMNWLHHTV